jgi:DNA-binding MurR/RpiR family transcriptional regulator
MFAKSNAAKAKRRRQTSRGASGNMGKLNATRSPGVPKKYETIVNLITHEYDGLSPRNQQIARYFTQNPNAVALESINAIAKKLGLHPSSLVRFAQTFGYSGFKELQTVFRTRLATAAPGFHERISALENELSRNIEGGNRGFLRDLVLRDIAALQTLLQGTSEESLSQSANLLAKAKVIYIAGQLRAAPIASFLRYLLTMLGRRVILLDPAGGLAGEMASTMSAKDVLVAISFRHYAQEVVAIGDMSSAKQTPAIVITDSQLSPLAKNARVLFEIPEDEYSFSRSLAAPVCLALCISVALAATLDPERKVSPRIPTVTQILRDREMLKR